MKRLQRMAGVSQRTIADARQGRSDTVLDGLLAPAQEAVQSVDAFVRSPATHAAVVRLVLLFSLGAFAFVSAISSYLLFYWVVVPTAGLREPVYLQYGQIGRAPWAFVPLEPVGGYLADSQPYDVALELVVPTSERNLDLGNFMVEVDIRARDNSSVFATSRPASLSYSSSHVRTLQDLTSPYTYLGVRAKAASSQRLLVSLCTQRVLQRRGRTPVSHVLLTVGRQDAHADDSRFDGGAGELQVYEAALRFDAHFRGLRWFMYYHSFISFLIFTAGFFGAEMFAALAAWGYIAYRRGSIAPFADQQPVAVGGRAKRSTDVDDKAAVRAQIRRADEEEAAQRQRLADDRSRRPGMDQVADDTDGTVSTVDDEASVSGSDATIEAEREAGWQDVRVKSEDDDGATIGGSETTAGRSTMRSFTPTTTTATSASSIRPRPTEPRRRTSAGVSVQTDDSAEPSEAD